MWLYIYIYIYPAVISCIINQGCWFGTVNCVSSTTQAPYCTCNLYFCSSNSFWFCVFGETPPSFSTCFSLHWVSCRLWHLFAGCWADWHCLAGIVNCERIYNAGCTMHHRKIRSYSWEVFSPTCDDMKWSSGLMASIYEWHNIERGKPCIKGFES